MLRSCFSRLNYLFSDLENSKKLFSIFYKFFDVFTKLCIFDALLFDPLIVIICRHFSCYFSEHDAENYTSILVVGKHGEIKRQVAWSNLRYLVCLHPPFPFTFNSIALNILPISLWKCNQIDLSSLNDLVFCLTISTFTLLDLSKFNGVSNWLSNYFTALANLIHRTSWY